ncbi:MAG: hypothetical protein NC311_09785 [Muribaculaceae bacterium]|nr:hypothetical protein [Muribaculaceae bacterium]
MGDEDKNVATGSESENFSWKRFWTLLSKPLKALFSIFGLVTGAGLIGLGTTLTGVMTTLGNENQNYELWVKYLVVFVMIVLVCFFVLTILMAIGFIRIKFVGDDTSKVVESSISKYNTSFDKNDEKFSNNLDKLGEYITQFSLAKFILDKPGIAKLEKETTGDKIIVMSSKFGLDTGDLKDIILNNLKKGITYVYLIPEQNSIEFEMDQFYRMVKNWWEAFKSSFSRDKKKSFMSDNYQALLESAESGNKDNVLTELHKYFCEHIRYVIIAKEYGIVTIVMYQKKEGFNQWNTIIMLPISSKDDYYAFQIPDAEGAEKKELEEKIQTLSLTSTKISFDI